MKYEIVGNSGKDPRIAVLVPRLQVAEVQKHYYQPHLKTLGESVLVADLYLDPRKKKTPVSEIK